MTNQKVETLISIALDKESNFWIHPFTGVLLFSRNDSKLSVHNKIALFNQLPPDRILEIPYGEITSISFNTKNFVIGFSSGDIVVVSNETYSIFLLKKNHKKPIYHLALSPDSTSLLYYLEEDKIYIYDLPKEKITKDFKIKDANPTSFVWLTDSKFVYTTNKSSIHYLDINKNKEIKTIENAHRNSEIITLSKHPRSLYTIITGDSQGEIKIWDLDENKIYPDLVNSFANKISQCTSITSSFSGDMIFAGHKTGYIELFDMRVPRGEKIVTYLQTGNQIKQIITSTQNGEFLVVFSSGTVKIFRGFSIDEINYEFQTFQNEIESFVKKLEQLPAWLSENGLDTVLPNEVGIIEKNLELATRLVTPSLIDKTNSPLMRENFKDFFKKFIQLEDRVRKIIEETSLKVQNAKEEIEKNEDLTKKLEQDIVLYLSNQNPSKISIDQISLYFNAPKDIVLSLIQKLDQKKVISGSLKSEYSGYFFDLTSTKIDGANQKIESKETDVITCHNCGADYNIERKTCPHCKADTIFCETCLKPIQKRQITINCPNCKSYFHFACFESKVKIIGRCPKCHEMVDFDSLIKKTVTQQKQQDQIVSGLNRLVSKQVSYHKQVEKKDEDDDLFDF